MKYLDEFRDPALAEKLVNRINRTVESGREYHFMEFCGGHTHTLFRYSIQDMLPDNIHMHHGPGCPVCVLPMARIDQAIQLATECDVILCCYGDTLRVPGSARRNLLQAKARGAEVRTIYSAAECLALAEQQPERQIVLFAIGFETTTPPTCLVLQEAEKKGRKNFSVFCNHVKTVPAMQAILDGELSQGIGSTRLDGLVGPGHVSLVTGSLVFEALAKKYDRPIVISGFEPLDLLHSLLLLVEESNARRSTVKVQYSRAVSPQGNKRSLALMEKYLAGRETFTWRGLGNLPHSAWQLKPEYAAFDAEQRFSMPALPEAKENKACLCPEVLRGQIRPDACPLYGKQCTPENPIGACMVSSEGACAAYYLYRSTGLANA